MKPKQHQPGMLLWLDAIHKVTGAMVLNWKAQSRATLLEWSARLKAVAKEMDSEARKRK